jgi:hypothetical protein
MERAVSRNSVVAMQGSRDQHGEIGLLLDRHSEPVVHHVDVAGHDPAHALVPIGLKSRTEDQTSLVEELPEPAGHVVTTVYRLRATSSSNW